MARKRRRNNLRAGELNLTAMIDVAFQLLSFFIITVHPMTVMTNLDVSRPAPGAKSQEEQIQDLLKITVYKGGYSMNGRKYTLPNLDKQLVKVAELNKKTTVTVISTDDAYHEDLVHVLDLCYKNGLRNIYLMSM
jgi:biopolymer transport protein ExbD